jgi:beta-ribofuranosylaminobenzene 5'-phosphate synthase
VKINSGWRAESLATSVPFRTMSHSIDVRAPCRLHFGMFSFGRSNRPQFGGVGAMIDPPAVEVAVRPAVEFMAKGVLTERVTRYAEMAAQAWRLSALPCCEITAHAPLNHVGLGVGTQVGLAVAAGLRAFLRMPELAIEELAASVGRGARSAVGSHGFRLGGLIIDGGKIDAEQESMPSPNIDFGLPLGDLARRAALPETWRIVLIRAADERGLEGEIESQAFACLPPVSDEVTRELWRITNDEMLPAVEQSNCARFGDAVYQFGHLAGQCFAPIQGGTFANPTIERLVGRIRDYGISGVGQSSWGPTVFAFTVDEAEANRLCDWLRESGDITEGDITISHPNNTGAHLSTLS